MADIVTADRVKETTATTLTGAYDLDGAASGFQTFAAGIGNGNKCYYAATDGTDWEVGIGTLTTGTPDSLARTIILASSNAGSAVSWGAGNKDIFTTYPAQLGRSLEINDSLGITTAQAATASGAQAIAIGEQTTATASSSIAIGLSADSTATDAIAIGGLSGATAVQAIAIGRSALADQTDSICIGENTNVGGSGAIAIGSDANANAARAVAIGDGVNNAGTDAVALVTTSSIGSRSVGIGVAAGASGASAVSVGDGSTSTATGAVCVGRTLAVNNQYGACLGGNLNTVTADYAAIIGGQNITNVVPGSIAHGNDDGECTMHVTASASTSDGTATICALVGGNTFDMPDNQVWHYKGFVSAYQTGGAAGTVGDVHTWEVEGCIKRVSGVSADVGTPAVTSKFSDTPATDAWTVAVAANDTTDTLDVTVTGETDKSITWSAYLTLVEASL